MAFRDEKAADVATAQTTTTAPSTGADGLDDAFKYLQILEHRNLDTSDVNLRALRRKVDWRILPIMFLCYSMQFLDKVNLNVSYLSRDEIID